MGKKNYDESSLNSHCKKHIFNYFLLRYNIKIKNWSKKRMVNWQTNWNGKNLKNKRKNCEDLPDTKVIGELVCLTACRKENAGKYVSVFREI